MIITWWWLLSAVPTVARDHASCCFFYCKVQDRPASYRTGRLSRASFLVVVVYGFQKRYTFSRGHYHHFVIYRRIYESKRYTVSAFLL
jgi:hypothetical protein